MTIEPVRLARVDEVHGEDWRSRGPIDDILVNTRADDRNWMHTSCHYHFERSDQKQQVLARYFSPSTLEKERRIKHLL